jgi:hypothetical protein
MKLSARSAVATLVSSLSLVASQASPVTGFSDLPVWGTGSNQSALVIEWNEGAAIETYAWAYQWSGSTTMADMLQSLAAADPRLFIRLDSQGAFGLSLFGIGYQKGSGPFGITGATADGGASADPVSFVNGVDDLNIDPANTEEPDTSLGVSASQAGDLYLEGWMDGGFWGSASGGTSVSLPGTADWSANSGVSAEVLQDDGWYALIYKPGFVGGDAPAGLVLAAIPESRAALLWLLGIGWVIWVRPRQP